MDFLASLNLTLAVSGLILGVLTIILFVDYFVFKGKYFSDKVRSFFWPLVILLSVGSMSLSLLYSEYFGFIPCALCWLQRIAIYPQALMSVIAFKMQDKVFFPLYGIGLSLFGFSIATYQYVEQIIPKATTSGVTKCILNSSNSDCAVKVIDEFGFVTFPLISAITFALLIILYLYIYRINKASN